MDAKITSVELLSLGFTFSEPPAMIIRAIGEVPTLGWKDGRLAPRIYISPPDDGIWDFDFIATSPKGHASTMESHIEGKLIIQPPPWAKGVRVHGSVNSLETFGGSVDNGKINKTKKFVESTNGGADGFPWNSQNYGGGNYFPWGHIQTDALALLASTIGELASNEENPNQELLTHNIGELMGLLVRVLVAGEPIEEDFRRNRINFVTSKETKKIVKIYVG